MRSAKPIFLAILAVALAAYAFDCSAATTPEQAMQCCKSMACSSHGHDAQDCCKTMPSMHAPFVQPSSGYGVFPSHVVVGVLLATEKAPAVDSSNGVIAAHCHAPPILYALAHAPLRI
jgi:hypothetical protein